MFLVLSAVLTARYTLVTQLEMLERRWAEDTLKAVRTTVTAELKKLSWTTRDWSVWDVTYQFMGDFNPDYVEENCTLDGFKTIRVHAALYYDETHALRQQVAFDFDSGSETTLSDPFVNRIPSVPGFFPEKDAQDCTTALLIDNATPMLAAACPILTSQSQGPRRGTLVFVRKIENEFLKQLQEIIDRPVTPRVVSLVDASPENPMDLPALEFSEERIIGRVVFPDAEQRAAFVLETTMERSVHRQTVRSLTFFGVALGILALWALAAQWYFMERKVLRRIAQLLHKTRGLSSEWAMPEKDQAMDEITLLQRSVDGLLKNLENAVEKNLEQQRETLTILETNPVGIILVDAETRTVSWANAKALELMGRDLKDIHGRSCKQLVCPSQDRDCPVLDHRRVVRDVECVMPTKNGEGVPVLRSIATVTYRQRPHLLEAVMDLRPQKALESQLDRAKKMETVGLVAGGVAHDLNNLLTTLVGYPDMLLRRMHADNPVYRHLTLIRDAGLKAGAIVQDLLTLTRRGVKATEPFDLGELVHRFLSSSEFAVLRSTHPRVRFQTQVESRRFPCQGSPIHLEKALSNLVRNAAEAIAETGTVTLAVEGVTLEEAHNGYETVPAGRWIRTRIEDTGAGIPEEDLTHIFEPFYTKKKMGRSGTGLGMTIVWHAVKDMGGFVDVQSAPGRGTTFSLYLPEADEPALEEADLPPQGFPKGSGESILVVEDMEDQRILVETMLTDLGYHVFTAADGREALALASTRKFDALVLDMMLTDDMDGPQVYQEILKVNPAQRAVVVSGDVSADRVAAIKNLGVSHFVPKPYSLAKLAEAVHAVLRGDSPPLQG